MLHFLAQQKLFCYILGIKRDVTFLIIRPNLDLVSEYQQHQDAPLEEEIEDGYDDAYDENIES